jgi:adenylate kinase family enzyme
MKNVLIFGRSGAGKSSLASLLGSKLNLPVFHLDKYFWTPGWIAKTKLEHAVDIEKILATNDTWVMDGNYKKSAFESRIKASDLIIVLDFGMCNCLYRVIKRSILHHGKTRPDMQEGCKEKFFPSAEFLSYIIHQRKTTVLPILKILKNYPDKKVVILRNQKEVDSWIAKLGN